MSRFITFAQQSSRLIFRPKNTSVPIWRQLSSCSFGSLVPTSRSVYLGSTSSLQTPLTPSPSLYHGSLFPRLTDFPLPPSPHIIIRHFYNKSSKHRSIIRTLKPHSKSRKFLETSSNLEPIANTHLLNLLERPFTSSQNPYLFVHGASGIPKHTDQLVSTVNDGKYFSIGCGEDSFYRRHDSLGVADGIGGWRNVTPLQNAVPDSALYSRKLMHYAYLELEKYDNVDEERFFHYNEVDPVDVLQKSYEQCIRDCTMEGIIGSSTALIAILRGDELRIANLGDCGISIIRRNVFVFRSEEQQHSFNFPYQLGTGSYDTAQDAQMYTIKVQRGDMIILGSDGIFDNLFEEDILEEIDPFVCQRTGSIRVQPQIISDSLARRAKNASEDLNNPSPFQSRAMQEGLYYLGGKKDDISVLVGVVTDSKDFSN